MEGSIIIPLSKIASEQNNSHCGADLLGSREWISVGETGLTDPLGRCPCLDGPEQEALRGRRFWDLVMYSFPGPTKDQGPLSFQLRETHMQKGGGVLCQGHNTLKWHALYSCRVVRSPGLDSVPLLLCSLSCLPLTSLVPSVLPPECH